MNGIRCALVDANGLVVDYFMADPLNAAIDKPIRDKQDRACMAHDQAMPGDTIIAGKWVQSPQNAADAAANEQAKPK